MKTVAVVAPKGGVGKTTLAENLYVEAQLRAMSSAIVDLDPQASATRWADRRSAMGEAVVGAHAARLARVLRAAEGQGTKLCILDTPPRANDATTEAIRLADMVLIPLRPHISDVETLQGVRDLLLGSGRPQAVVVINAAPVQGERHEDAAGAARDLGFLVCPIVIHHRLAFGDAQIKGQGVCEHQPNGLAAAESGKLARFVVKQLRSKELKWRRPI